MELKKVSYQLDPDDAAPRPGEYLVTIGQRGGVLSVMVIKTVRKVNHRLVKDYQAYELQLYNRPDLKPFAEYERRLNSLSVWVRGEPALPCMWIPRSKK